jgi:hypothetical protein
MTARETVALKVSTIMAFAIKSSLQIAADKEVIEITDARFVVADANAYWLLAYRLQNLIADPSHLLDAISSIIADYFN